MVAAAVLFSAGKNIGSHPRPCGLYTGEVGETQGRHMLL